MTERDCNTCANHVQGESLDDVPVGCWTCSSAETVTNGAHVLPLWKPIELRQMTQNEAFDAAFDIPIGVPMLSLTALQQQVGGAHYKGLKIQPMEYSVANGLNACAHTAIKYITRKKGDTAKRLEDLDKAIHSIELYKQFIQDGILED